MDCLELIEIFNKTGGNIICNYDTNKVKVLHTNLECNIKPKDYKMLEYTLFEYGNSPYNVTHIKGKFMNISDIANSNIKLKNIFLNNDEIGYDVKFQNMYDH